jgi:Uncharacterised protein family (UPF0153).
MFRSLFGQTDGRINFFAFSAFAMSESKIKIFYRQVDALAEKLSEIHAARLKCKRGCAACCVDEITVFEAEAENIRANHAELLRSEKPHEPGKCAFLDADNACRIYENRPYVCRTQGLPLRWFEEDFEEIFEYRDICPLNEAGEPLENLPEEQCWTIGDFESRLAALQAEFGAGEMRRVRLRDLFSEKENS